MLLQQKSVAQKDPPGHDGTYDEPHLSVAKPLLEEVMLEKTEQWFTKQMEVPYSGCSPGMIQRRPARITAGFIQVVIQAAKSIMVNPTTQRGYLNSSA